MPIQTIVIIVGSLAALTGVAVILRNIKNGREDTPTFARIGPLELNGGAGAITIAVGGMMIVGSILWLPGRSTGSEPAPGPTETRTGSSSTHPMTTKPAPVPVGISTPTSGQKVVGKSGVRLQGTAPDSDDRKLWLFDHADDNQYYLVSSSPLTVAHGQWAIQDSQIGSATPEDDGHIFVLTLARADENCAATLTNAKRNGEGDITFDHLPEGCDTAASVDIVKESSR